MKTRYAVLAAMLFTTVLACSAPAPVQTPAASAPPTPSVTPAPPTATPALAATPVSVPATDTVYITNTGKKYHRDGCRWLKSRIPISRREAEAKGYGPCKVCNP